MTMKTSQYIWQNGTMKPWAEATVHVLSHALHYGSSVFEGVRAYQCRDGGTAIFRLQDHVRRLFDSARIHRIPMPFDEAAIVRACHGLIRDNGLRSAYLRPIAFRGYGGLGVVANETVPTDVVIAAFEWGAYLGENGMEEGVDAGVSSWQRPAPNTLPALAKAGGNYLSSQLIGAEAQRHGYADGIALNTNGTLSEGGGENLFLVHRGVLYTPSAETSILSGITRDTVITLARDRGLEVREQALPREMLYLADEAFFTGTAAEITPIRSVDGMSLPSEGRGPVTLALQQAFFGLFDGRTEDHHGWLDTVAPDEAMNTDTEKHGEVINDTSEVAV